MRLANWWAGSSSPHAESAVSAGACTGAPTIGTAGRPAKVPHHDATGPPPISGDSAGSATTPADLEDFDRPHLLRVAIVG